jgi:hypothetical protein
MTFERKVLQFSVISFHPTFFFFPPWLALALFFCCSSPLQLCCDVCEWCVHHLAFPSCLTEPTEPERGATMHAHFSFHIVDSSAGFHFPSSTIAIAIAVVVFCSLTSGHNVVNQAEINLSGIIIKFFTDSDGGL